MRILSVSALKFCMLFLCFVNCLSCEYDIDDYENDISNEIVPRKISKPLNNVDAEIEVTIDIYDSSSYCYSDYNDLELCIGSDSQCYSLFTCFPGTGCLPPTQDATCIIANHIGTNGPHTPADDHPFVHHPDDWDSIYLRNNSSSQTLYLDDLEVNFVYRKHPDPADTDPPNYKSYTFVSNIDSCVTGPIEPLEKKYFGDCTKRIREERMEDVTGIDFEDLPWMVRKAAYDQGQSGIAKYDPIENGGENGCNEFFLYFASQYSNNIHYSCQFDDLSCSYFRHWVYDDRSLTRTQFAKADRLYKVVFKTHLVDDPCGRAIVRTGIGGIYKCPDKDCLNPDRNSPYIPKIGDYYNAVKPDGFHVMMYLGNIEWDDNNTPTNPWDDSLQTSVIHKDNPLVLSVRSRNYDINLKYNANGNASPCDPFKREFFFGEVDHDVPCPVGIIDGKFFSRPWLSGARPYNGPNAGFRATQNAFLQATLL